MFNLFRARSLTPAILALAAAASMAPAQQGGRPTAPKRQDDPSQGALPATAARVRSTLEKVIHREVLPNGLEVIVVENHGVPLATVEIDVKNGAFTQTPERRT